MMFLMISFGFVLTCLFSVENAQAQTLSNEWSASPVILREGEFPGLKALQETRNAANYKHGIHVLYIDPATGKPYDEEPEYEFLWVGTKMHFRNDLVRTVAYPGETVETICAKAEESGDDCVKNLRKFNPPEFASLETHVPLDFKFKKVEIAQETETGTGKSQGKKGEVDQGVTVTGTDNGKKSGNSWTVPLSGREIGFIAIIILLLLILAYHERHAFPLLLLYRPSNRQKLKLLGENLLKRFDLSHDLGIKVSWLLPRIRFSGFEHYTTQLAGRLDEVSDEYKSLDLRLYRSYALSHRYDFPTGTLTVAVWNIAGWNPRRISLSEKLAREERLMKLGNEIADVVARPYVTAAGGERLSRFVRSKGEDGTLQITIADSNIVQLPKSLQILEEHVKDWLSEEGIYDLNLVDVKTTSNRVTIELQEQEKIA